MGGCRITRVGFAGVASSDTECESVRGVRCRGTLAPGRGLVVPVYVCDGLHARVKPSASLSDK